MDDLITKAAQLLADTKRTVALTGAGISVESKIPSFRGAGGIWEKIDPMEFAHIDSFLKDPEKVWKGFLAEMKNIIDDALPNDAHYWLYKLEKLKILSTIITQNIDGLHQMAGNTDVIEFHGNFANQRCLNCHKVIKTSDLNLDTIPPLCECGGIYRPNCVFFGEMIPSDLLQRSKELAVSCDIMLVIGTSAVVQPAASMPVIAKQTGSKVIEINSEPTELSYSISDIFIQEKASVVMNRLIGMLDEGELLT